MITVLARQVGDALGCPDGVLVFDPSAFPKKGTESVGVQRQWRRRLGKVDNCQVGVYLAYVGRAEHALVDARLYLPKGWAPGDDEMGKVPEFRGQLHARGERYLLAVPSNTLVRDLDAEPPPYSGHGRHPKSPWLRVDRLRAALPKSAWTTVEVRDGEKGPLVVEAVKVRVQAKSAPRDGLEETLVVIRERQSDGSIKHDYYLLSVRRRARHAARRIHPREQGGTPRRRVPAASRGRSRAGRLRSSHMAWLASSSNALAGGDLVSHARDAAGKENELRR
jgi:hypothetical protein